MRLTSDELKVFKKIACEHDAKILSALGFEINGNINIQSACPVHGGDNKTAFSYHLGKCCWSCFTHNCHQKYGNDIIGLCRGLKKMNFQDTIDWIKEVISSDQFEEIKINKEQYNSLHNPLICDKKTKKILTQRMILYSSVTFQKKLVSILSLECRLVEKHITTGSWCQSGISLVSWSA